MQKQACFLHHQEGCGFWSGVRPGQFVVLGVIACPQAVTMLPGLGSRHPCCWAGSCYTGYSATCQVSVVFSARSLFMFTDVVSHDLTWVMLPLVFDAYFLKAVELLLPRQLIIISQ